MSAGTPPRTPHWANHLMWLLPCLCGWAGYYCHSGLPTAPSAAKNPGSAAPVAAASRRSNERSHPSVGSVLGTFRKAQDEQRERIEHSAIDDLSPDDLCAAILQAKQAGKGEREYRDFARALGHEQGEAGILWLLKNAPESRFPAMDGWKSADPKAALEYVLKSDMALPCTSQTLADLLDHVAESQGGAELVATVKQVRWELFDPSYPRYIYGSGSDSDEGVVRLLNISSEPAIQKIWLHSGALDEIAAQGERMDGFFADYLLQEPAVALEDLATHWPWQEEDRATYGLQFTIDDWLDKVPQEEVTRVDEVILHASPSARAMLTLFQEDLHTRKKFPHLPFSDPDRR